MFDSFHCSICLSSYCLQTQKKNMIIFGEIQNQWYVVNWTESLVFQRVFQILHKNILEIIIYKNDTRTEKVIQI